MPWQVHDVSILSTLEIFGACVRCLGCSVQVPPCDNGGELRRLITAGGGKVAEKSSKDVINLSLD